jgi:hypothetical protein
MRPKKTVYSNAEIPGRIHALQPFLSEGKLPDGTRRWSGYSGPATSFGHLPRKYHEAVRSAVYVVYSYDTPIGWVMEHPHGEDPYVYVIPDVSYSPTTGQHQYAVLEAWAEGRKRQGVTRKWQMDGARREVVRVPGNAEVYGVERRLRAGGMDGARPGSVVGRRSVYDDTGDDASHWSPKDPEWERRLYPNAPYRSPNHP